MAGNGYFEFKNNGNQLELVLYAPKTDGRRVAMEDVIHCLDKQRIDVADLTKIHKTVSEYTEDTSIVIGKAVTPFDSWVEYTVAENALSIVAVHYPGCIGMPALNREEVLRDLDNMNVTYGIVDTEINRLCDAQNYLEKIVIAKGTEPVQGKDGVLTYQFDVDKKAKPSIKEDGTVDYRDNDGLNHIKEGDVVAVITPEDKGVPGKNVYGKEIQPYRVKRAVFKYGRNLEVSEDGCKLISKVSGHVSLEGNKVFVSNILEVVDVDNSTGNIDYDGDVLITGNVLAGFSVKATGNIEVRGVVEGASVYAGGDITIVRGIQGMNKAEIVCRGSMVTKFIESAENITVEGNLETGTLLHSKVSVKGSIVVQGRNGLIVGGDVRSIHGISAKTIGNEMGTLTIVGVGMDPTLKKEIEQLRKSITTDTENKDKMNRIVTVLRRKQESAGSLEPEKIKQLQQTTRNMIILEQNLKQMRSRLNELEQMLIDDDSARIKISRSAHSGVKLVFGDEQMTLKQRVDYCQFAKKGADIKMLQL